MYIYILIHIYIYIIYIYGAKGRDLWSEGGRAR